jgi:hypothetical protein
LCRSFQELPPTHELRVTVHGVIDDRALSGAIGRFLSRLRYRIRKAGAEFEYFAVNEWSDGHRHTHFLVRSDFNVTSALIGELWAKTLPRLPFTHHCAAVRSPAAVAKYVVKHLKDDSKKELPPQHFSGRIYRNSQGFFTKPVAELWKELCREWYPARQPSEAEPAEEIAVSANIEGEKQ